MFSTGFLTGWWFHHRLVEPHLQPQVNEAVEGYLLPEWFAKPAPEYSIPEQSVVDMQTTNKVAVDFGRALKEQRLDDALVLYQQQERVADISSLRRRLLEVIASWSKENQTGLAIETLERFTQHYYQDQELLTELAKLYLNDKEYISSLETLLNARSFLMAGKEHERLTSEILSLAKDIFHKHSGKQTLETILQLFQKLTMLEPEQGFYRYALAESYLAINDANSAVSELEILQMDPEYEKKASTMLMALLPPPVENVEEKQTAGIPLQLTGKHYIASVTLQDNTRVNLMLDTGASLTTLPDELLLNLKRRRMAHRVSHTNINTAGGTVFAPVYQVKELTLGQFVLKNLEVAGMRSGLPQADGLLGMNVLRQFHFQIDQDRSQLILTPR